MAPTISCSSASSGAAPSTSPSTATTSKPWAPNPSLATRIPGELAGKHVVIVDDVLYTGRTVRAALDELADFGRPKRISLCVLVDRGGRELPIQADIVGKSVKTGPDERVDVQVEELDGRDQVDVIR